MVRLLSKHQKNVPTPLGGWDGGWCRTRDCNCCEGSIGCKEDRGVLHNDLFIQVIRFCVNNYFRCLNWSFSDRLIPMIRAFKIPHESDLGDFAVHVTSIREIKDWLGNMTVPYCIIEFDLTDEQAVELMLSIEGAISVTKTELLDPAYSVWLP